MHGGYFMVVTKADIPCPEYPISLNSTPHVSGSDTAEPLCIIQNGYGMLITTNESPYG
jgi:hypothetical protein